MFNWCSPSITPHHHPSTQPCLCLPPPLCLSSFHPFHHNPLPGSGVRPPYTNRVPVLQRCVGQREALPPSPKDGAQNCSLHGAKRPLRESEEAPGGTPTSTSSLCDDAGFGATRKRLHIKAEPEETEEEEQAFHPEKRARLCIGEDLTAHIPRLLSSPLISPTLTIICQIEPPPFHLKVPLR